MLSINLPEIIDQINSRRNRVRYQFQELGLMLAEKLSDPRHKALYMKIAKNEEQELVMDALHYVLASPNATGNIGALFMWKLKELKDRPILPVPIRYDITGGYLKIGIITQAVRGDMPLLVAALNEYSQKTNNIGHIVVQLTTSGFVIPQESPFQDLKESVDEMLKDFKRKVFITLYSQWQWIGDSASLPHGNIEGVLKLGTPVLTKRVLKGRIPPS